MQNNEPALDTEELLHLAIQASKNKNNEATIRYLKSALQLSPEAADVHFMLGATYADLAMFERAESSLQEAIRLNPDFEAANFQLGLLYIVNNQIENATTAWQKLDSTSEDNAYYLFKSGLLSLSRDEFDKSIDYINRGLKANQDNPPLSENMTRILNDILASQQQSRPEEIKPQQTRQVQLKAYEDTNHK